MRIMGIGMPEALVGLYMLLVYAVFIAIFSAILYFVVKKAVAAALREVRDEDRRGPEK